MRCTICKTTLPTNNHAIVDGLYFCLKCFLEQYGSESICQTCGNSPSIKANKRTTFGSTISLNSNRSDRTSETPNRVGTAISKFFHNIRSPSANRDRDHHKPPRPTKTPPKTCQVCLEEKSSKRFRPISDHQCQQTPRTICDACIYQHIQQSFQEMCNDDVRCPELQCNRKYNHETIKNILLTNKDIKLFQRYDRFQMHHQLEQMDEFIWCSNPKCQMGQLNEGGNRNNIVRCIRCSQKTCFTHRTPWHEGLTCQQYDARTNGDLKETLKWLNQNTKTCPNCPYQIEKNDGCDHMTCSKCKYEFCWSCLANYDQIRRNGNHRHHPTCKHYAAYEKQ